MVYVANLQRPFMALIVICEQSSPQTKWLERGLATRSQNRTHYTYILLDLPNYEEDF